MISIHKNPFAGRRRGFCYAEGQYPKEERTRGTVSRTEA